MSNPSAFVTRQWPLAPAHSCREKPNCEKLGLKGANWHWLRHANATMLDAVGASLGTVQALLGHSSSQITREVYLHSVPTDAKDAVQRLENLFDGPKRTQLPDRLDIALT